MFIVYSTAMILTFTALLNIKKFNVETEAESFGAIASYMFLVFLLLFTVFLCLFIAYFWWSLRKIRKEGNNINESIIFQEKTTDAKKPNKNNTDSNKNIRNTTFLGKYFFNPFRYIHLFHYIYPLCFLMRRVLVGAIFALLENSGFEQLLCLSLLSGLNLVYHSTYQPFQSKLHNITIVLLELAYL